MTGTEIKKVSQLCNTYQRPLLAQLVKRLSGFTHGQVQSKDIIPEVNSTVEPLKLEPNFLLKSPLPSKNGEVVTSVPPDKTLKTSII
jgi:hypothetical protein